jgi:prepilin-type N-terminal cleavage/methylation domain-containing protein
VKRAFSLIEVMASSALLLVGLSAVFSSFGSLSHLVAHNRKVDTGVHIAQQVAEELTSLARTSSELKGGIHTGARYNDLGQRVGDGAFLVTWTVSSWASPQLNSFARIVVTTSWEEEGEAKSIDLTLYRDSKL